MKHSGFVSGSLGSQRGSLLYSTLVVIALLSMMMMFTWRSIFQNQKELDRIKLATSRDLVVESALHQSRVATYYYYSISENDPVNEMLIKCLVDDDLGDDCVVAPGNYPMKLVDFDSSATPSRLAVTGTATTPAYYNYYGQACQNLSEDCPFEITASFQPTCPAAAATCAAASTIAVSVSVSVNPAYRSDLLPLAQVVSTQVVSITDIHGSYFPVLPPTSPRGTPISFGAGYGGEISQLLRGVTPSGPSGPTAPPPPTTASITTCGAGELKGVSCGSFQF